MITYVTTGWMGRRLVDSSVVVISTAFIHSAKSRTGKCVERALIESRKSRAADQRIECSLLLVQPGKSSAANERVERSLIESAEAGAGKCVETASSTTTLLIHAVESGARKRVETLFVHATTAAAADGRLCVSIHDVLFVRLHRHIAASTSTPTHRRCDHASSNGTRTAIGRNTTGNVDQ